MPLGVRWLPQAWQQVNALPAEMYKDAQRTAGGLLADPFPPGTEPDPDIPDTYALRTGLIRLAYRVIGDEIDIVGVWPNS